jgi:hypothetical protein
MKFALTILLATCCLGLPPTATFAAEDLTLVVSAGPHDRENTPVSVMVDVPSNAQGATITTADGTKLPGQLTAPGVLHESAKGRRELHFVLPSLKKGKSLELKVTLLKDAATGGGFAWEEQPNEFAELSCGDRPVLRYMCLPFDDSTPEKRHDSYKVFHHAYNPAGTAIITKGPGGRYTHHRGIFFGFSRVSYKGGGADIWHCKGDAHQTHEGFMAEEAGPVLGRHTVAVDWHGSGKEVFANEARELTVYAMPGGRLIEFASRISSQVEGLKFDGDPQHAGFQFRASQKVADGDQKATYYLRTDGKGQPGETRNWGKGNDECANRPWNAMSFVIDGDRYTTVYLDHPGNPKEARYSERTYGRFGSYFVYEFEEDKCLTVNYRIWLQDGEMTVEQAQALCDDFVEPVEVTVK